MKLLTKLMIAGGAISPPSTPAFTVTLDNLVGLTGGGTTNVFMTGSTGGGGVITLKASASRLTGVAPLYVNFDATETTSTLSSNPSHELFFAWDFGDPTAGTWANGVQSTGLNNKNTAFGPVVGHVFETPGTYVVTPVAIDGDPAHTASRTKTIVVQDPNVVYAGALTICVSHSGNFTGKPTGALEVNTAGNTDMYAAFNTYKASNKRILFCKADAWTCSDQNTFANVTGMTISGYGTGAARSAVFNASASDTLVEVTPANIGGAVFNLNAGNSDVRIHNFKIASNGGTKAVGINNSISGVLIHKVEIRGCSNGFSAPTGGGGINNVMDQLCLHECLLDEVWSGSGTGGQGVYVGLVRGGVMGCYFDNCNYGEQTLRTPYLDRAHINSNYIARPNKTKNVLKIHSFNYTEVALYSEKFVVSANVLDLRGGYAYNGTTVTEVGDCGMVIGNGGSDGTGIGKERVRNGIVENNYTYGCRGDPKTLSFGSFNCPNMTVRNNIADFLLGATSAEYIPTYTFGSRGAVFCYVGNSTPDPTVGVRIYNNSMYCNMDDGTNPMVVISGADTAQVDIRNNICYQPYIGYWADKPIYVTNGATVAAYTASNNTVNQNTNPNFTATPPVTLADWKPATGSYAINGGTSVPVLRDFNNASRVGAGNHMGAVLP